MAEIAEKEWKDRGNNKGA